MVKWLEKPKGHNTNHMRTSLGLQRSSGNNVNNVMLKTVSFTSTALIFYPGICGLFRANRFLKHIQVNKNKRF